MSTEFQLPAAVRVLCRSMQAVALLILVVAVYLGVAGGGVDTIIETYRNQMDDPIRQAVQYTTFKRALLTTLATLSFYSPLFVVFGVWRVFGAFANGPILSARAVKTIRFLGWLVIARFIASIATLPAMMIAFTYDNPEGKGLLAVAVSTDQLQVLLYGGLFLVIGHVLTKAVEVAEENGEFI